jgi:hypothetical protein
LKDLHVEFDKICLDTDHNSVKMIIKEIDGEDIILHFSKSPRVKLLSEMQNHLYNTRQEFKKYMRKAKEEKEEREKDTRRKLNEEAMKKTRVEISKMINKFEDERK